MAALPEGLLGGHDASELHPFEDASLVFYDDTTAFYDVHHDSWYEGNVTQKAADKKTNIDTSKHRNMETWKHRNIETSHSAVGDPHSGPVGRLVGMTHET